MPTYISLARYTERGEAHIKEGPARIDALKQAFRANGAELKAFYLVMGQYDTMIIFEAPNDEACAKLMLSVGAAGNVHTETQRAFTEAEYRKLIASLP